MFTHKLIHAAALIGAIAFTQAASPQVARFGFGSTATPEELSKFFSIPPDGRGLPAGSGNAPRARKSTRAPAPPVTATSSRAILRKA